MEHLEPNDSVIDSLPIITAYLHAVASSLKPNTDRKARAVLTVTCLPSFEPEWMLSLECSRNGHYTIYANTADETIWPLDEPKSISPVKSTCGVSERVGSAIHRVFQMALMGTRYPASPREGLDGVTYHFSYDRMCGKTWSPLSESIPGKLVTLAQTVYEGSIAGQIDEPKIDRLIDWFEGNLIGIDLNR